jgi:putative nucleotidyltransferase with HDIG domain
MAASVDLSKIPAFPPVAARLLGQLDDDSLEILEIAETIRGDPGLSAALLERANSPLFGFSHRIETVARAINMLGLSTVHRLTLTAVAHSFMKHGLKLVEFQRCWRHTLATAFLASELAWACSMREEEAYMAGLLHDIGRIALISAYADEYSIVLRRAEEETYDILELEREHFGVDHCELGRRLAESWNLPDPMRVAAGRHHDRPDSSEVDLLKLVQLACRLADTVGFEAVKPLRGESLEKIRAKLPDPAQERFQMSLEQVQIALENEMRIYSGIQTPRQVVIPEHADSVEEQPPAASAVEPPLSKLVFWTAVTATLFLLLAAVYVLGR